MKRFRLLLALALISSVAASVTTHAAPLGAYMSGNDFVIHCRNPSFDAEHSMESGACMGYIWGSVGGTYVGARINNPKHQAAGRGHIGIKAGITSAQALQIVMNYADKHPERLEEPASALIYLALSEAWGEIGR